MRGFDFRVPDSVPAALADATASSAYLAGGTTLVDLMKLDVMAPDRVIDLDRLPLRGIRADRRGLTIGALERMSDVAADPRVADGYPVLVQALLESASPQLRNMASMGGNLLQRTRCDYFRDASSPCNKRAPGTGCPALTGENRTHAILGTSDACAATHASDLAVALVALDATLRLHGPQGVREVDLAHFYRLPEEHPEVETVLQQAELVTAIVVPALACARRSAYLKVRDRSAYEFALCSAAVALDLHGRTVRDVRVAVGGVGTRPWRLPRVEAALRGRRATQRTFQDAADLATEEAKPLAHNGFKVALTRRTIVRALLGVAGER